MGVIRRMGVAAFATLAVAVQAAPYSQLVVFGDSLSDAGNAYAMTGEPLIPNYPHFPPSPPYATTFSNGPTAAQYLAAQYGIKVELGWPSTTAASNNFAVGGARNGLGNYNVEVGSPPGLGVAYPALATTGIQAQVGRYAAAHASGVPDPSRTLFLVWGGPNDIFLAVETLPPDEIGNAVKQAVADLTNDLLALAGLGAKNLLVPSMPDLGKTPEALKLGPEASGLLSLISGFYNGGIDAMLHGLSDVLGPAGVRLFGFDTAGFFDEVASDPAFGFTNTTESCLYDGGEAALLSGCQGYLYFDNVHPTTAAHQLLAAQFAAAAVPEPGALSLVLLALLPLAWQRHRRR